MTIPFRLTSERLILRPFALSDAVDVQRLAGDFSVADTTRVVPHPYLDGMAEDWISTHEPPSDVAIQLELAAVEKETSALVGAVSLVAISHHDSRAEMGYWIGKSYWGKGYCTEAARVLLRHAFAHLRLNRVCARYLKRNAASGRVLEKIGMQEEGCLRQENKKWDVFEDVVVCGILRSEWEASTSLAEDAAN